MLNRNKSYEVKDWFGDKVAQEVKRNISTGKIQKACKMGLL